MRSLIAIALIACLALPALAADPVQQETPEQRDQRLAWWRDARFGMFIHWGVYAVPAGTYKDKRVGGIGEWIMRNAQIPVADYRAYAKQFNPVKYDPQAWADLARDAGMKYIVITSKHHDGFALFDSKVTDWDIVDATPYGKDVLAPLAAAARKDGLKFGLYYSQAQDWTHPGGAKAGSPDGGGWDDAHKGSFDEYLKKIAVPQVREILANYQPDILWWDTPVLMTRQRADLFRPLLALKPGIITNNRLGGGYAGDSDTPEQHIPATGIPGRDWEVCMTMNDTWGYKSYDTNWKSTDDLIHKLCDIASKGGNFLLNVGPTPEGEIPQPSIERLRAVGQWMKVNGEAIYGTTASPFQRLAWGRCTKKLGPDSTTLYLHVFNWPADGRLVVPGLRNKVTSASLLAGGDALKSEQTAEGLILQVPAKAPDPIASVVKLVIAGAPDIAKVLPRQAPDGSMTLPAMEADLDAAGSEIKVEDKNGQPNIGYWLEPRATASWRFVITKPGKFDVVADLASTAGSKFQVVLDKDKASIAAQSPSTGDYARFQKVTLGQVTIEAAGEHVLLVKPDAAGWKPVNIRTLTLKPTEK